MSIGLFRLQHAELFRCVQCTDHDMDYVVCDGVALSFQQHRMTSNAFARDYTSDPKGPVAAERGYCKRNRIFLDEMPGERELLIKLTDDGLTASEFAQLLQGLDTPPSPDNADNAAALSKLLREMSQANLLGGQTAPQSKYQLRRLEGRRGVILGEFVRSLGHTSPVTAMLPTAEAILHVRAREVLSLRHWPFVLCLVRALA
jgi:hypothetical protein